MSIKDKQIRYTYLVANIQSGQVLGELPIRGCTWGLKLNDVGDLSAAISWNPVTKAMNLKPNTSPGLRVIYVLRNFEIVWSGIIWKRKYSKKAAGNEVPVVELECETFESYLNRRFQRITKVFTARDQIDIARFLLNQLNDLPNGTINIEVDSTTTSSRQRDRTFFNYEFKTLGEELNQLANLIDGFDYAIRPYQDSNGSIRQKMTFGYPQLGQTADKTNLFFDFPTNISEFTSSEDVTDAATREYAIGSGDGVDQLTARAENITPLSQGYPALEGSMSYTTVTRSLTLLEHATTDLARATPPIRELDIVIRGDQDPMPGTYFPGDHARVRINDDWFANPVDDIFRISEISVAVPEDSGPEVVTISFDDAIKIGDESEEAPGPVKSTIKKKKKK